jgi:hypothetical protein
MSISDILQYRDPDEVADTIMASGDIDADTLAFAVVNAMRRISRMEADIVSLKVAMKEAQSTNLELLQQLDRMLARFEKRYF